MNFKPSDFFIGVADFFSVICPGALLTYFLIEQLQLYHIDLAGVFPAITNDTQMSVVFLFATYIAGNLIFPVAALLDKFIYDKIRIKFLTKNADLCYLKATEIREQHLCSGKWINEQIASSEMMDDANKKKASEKKDHDKEIINTYKWCQHFIALKQPALLSEVKRLEADSKFFRSLVVVFAVMFFMKITAPLYAVCFLGLALLSLYRYADMRYKANERAFELVVTMETEKQTA